MLEGGVLDRSIPTGEVSAQFAVGRAFAKAGEAFQDKSLTPTERWDKIASFVPEIGPLGMKLVQTVIPFIQFKSERTPEEEAMLTAFSGIHTKFGNVDQEKSKQVISEIPSVMTGRLTVDQNTLVGAASTAEVYRASSTSLPNKELVAKIQKPGAKEQFHETFTYSRSLLSELGVNNPLAKAFLDMTEDAYVEEFDTTVEMQNLEKLRKIGIRSPKPYQELSSEKAIVMESIKGGLPLGEYLQTADDTSRKKVAGKYVASLVRMIRHGVIHGDPHGGNVVIDKKERLHWIDPQPLIEFSFKEAFRIGMVMWHMRSGKSGKVIDGLNKLADTKLGVHDLQTLKAKTKGLQGFDLLKSVFDKGLLPPKRHLVLARSLAEGAGLIVNALPDKKSVGSWLGVMLKGAIKSFVKQ